MTRNLLLSGGPTGHDFAGLAQTLAAAVAVDGIESETVDDVVEFAARLADPRTRPDLITVFALRFTMQHPRYADTRARWASEATETMRSAIGSFVGQGGGLLAMHTACVCFDDWPGWGELIGAAWDWSASSHEPPGPALVQPVAGTHPLTEGIESFTVTDEIYESLAVRSDLEVLFECDRGGARQPIVWVRRHGAGRVVVDALGHSAESLQHPTHDLVLRRSARWLLGEPDEVVRATGPTSAAADLSDPSRN